MKCEICDSELLEDHCPLCSSEHRERFRALQADVFPMTAMPPLGAFSAQVTSSLRRALLEEDLSGAERLWTQTLAGMRPLGDSGRLQLAAALDACAALKVAMGKPEEAVRLAQRAATARKDPRELQRKQATTSATGGPGWDNSAWQRLQSDHDDPDRQAAIARVKEEMAQSELRSSKKKRALRAGALGLVGVAGGTACGAVGIPALAAGAVGAGLGWMLGRDKP